VAEQYNPIVRTFNQLRAVLRESLGVARHHVCPEMPLELLIPVDRRREVWGRLRAEGLPVLDLELSSWDEMQNGLVALKTAGSLALMLQAWPALLTFYPLLLIACCASTRRAIHFPCGLTTVGELAISLTSVRDHQDSGYRWTYNEISTKVRMVLAESLNLDMEQVQPESTLAELGAG